MRRRVAVNTKSRSKLGPSLGTQAVGGEAPRPSALARGEDSLYCGYLTLNLPCMLAA
jgi:hypothetical protein